MFAKEIYTARRRALMEQLKDEGGLVLLMGNEEVGMNYAANPYPFRQDSTFLYFFGLDRPGLHALLDLEEGSATLFGTDFTLDDIVWMGPQPTLQELAERCGVAATAAPEHLAGRLAEARQQGRTVHFLPPYRAENKILLSEWLGLPIGGLREAASEALIRAVVSLRSHKSPEEVAEMERAVEITGQMHIAAMKAAREGQKEAELAGMVEGIAIAAGGRLSYPAILTVNGQTLHNHYHGNTLEKGRLVLGDFGAETALHYAGDITRTFPVDKKFTPLQRDLYQLVLQIENDAIASLRPGLPYKEVHLQAARQLARGLTDLGFMKGNPDDAVEAGAHALFFPHGLGHMIGLDVHDMEDLGEDFVGYSETVRRSNQFGTAYLRLGRELEPGFVLTVEPGLYFIPELMDKWQGDGLHTDFIDYEKVQGLRDFGGIRIEDNVLITEDGHRVLGSPIPRTVEEVEALRS